MHNIIAPRPISRPSPPKLQPTPQGPKKFLLFLLICGIFGLFAYWRGMDEVIIGDDGALVLSPERQDELDRRIYRLDNAEQYVLIAMYDGHYPCYNCGPDTLKIFLFAGETWKYGVTIQGQKGRYSTKKLNGMGLDYRVQLRSNIHNCLKAEAKMIFHYPLMPENIKRLRPINRPPGNKNDL